MGYSPPVYAIITSKEHKNMSCNCQNQNLCNHVNFSLDGTYLVPSVGNVPGDGVDLARVIAEGETDTRLTLDVVGSRLIYRNEHSLTGDGSPDNIPIEGIANLINISDLGDVDAGLLNTGDLLTYDGVKGTWVPYTIPVGDFVSNIGMDTDGRLVKGGSAGGGGNTTGASKYIGESFSFWGAPAKFPTGCVHLDGRELSRVVYAELFGILGTTYGVGNGTTTFNIPDTRDYTTVNVGTTGNFNALGKKAGVASQTMTAAQMPVHSHSVSDPGHSHNTTRDPVVTSGGGNSRLVGGSGQQTAWSQGGLIAAAGTGIWINNNGGGQAQNNLQPSVARYELMRII